MGVTITPDGQFIITEDAEDTSTSDLIGGGFSPDPNAAALGQAVGGGQASLARFEQGTQGSIFSPYLKDDEFAAWSSIPVEQRASVQSLMVSLGLVNPTNANPVYPGEWGEATRKGFTHLMAAGNASGSRWTTVLNRLIQSQQQGVLSFGGGGGGGGGGGTAVPDYLPPDPATLRQNVRQAIQSTLGRDPQAQELQVLADELGSLARQQFDAAVAGGQQVDPAARFDELIQSKYATELDIINQRQEAAAGQQRASQSVSLVDRMVSAGMQGGI